MGVICIRRKSSAIAPFTLYDLGAGKGPTELPEVTENYSNNVGYAAVCLLVTGCYCAYLRYMRSYQL